jgi:hypothetical protein
MALFESGVRMLSNRMPKVVSPKAHAIIDYATAAAFFGMGAYLWRRNRRAAVASLICGAAEVGTAAVTDYPGGVRPYISFEQHGKIDSIMSGIVTTMPNMLFFANHPSARFFHGQGVMMAAATGMTDFEALPSSPRQKRDLEEAA